MAEGSSRASQWSPQHAKSSTMTPSLQGAMSMPITADGWSARAEVEPRGPTSSATDARPAGRKPSLESCASRRKTQPAMAFESYWLSECGSRARYVSYWTVSARCSPTIPRSAACQSRKGRALQSLLRPLRNGADAALRLGRSRAQFTKVVRSRSGGVDRFVPRRGDASAVRDP